VRDVALLVWQPDGKHLWAMGLYFRTLRCIIVNKDKVTQTQAEFVGQGPEIFRFGPPVDLRRDEVFLPQWHLRVMLEDCTDVLRIILAAKTEEHAGIVLLHHELLEVSEARSNRHADRAVLPANAPPERLITV